jgi:Zn-dependent protease
MSSCHAPAAQAAEFKEVGDMRTPIVPAPGGISMRAPGLQLQLTPGVLLLFGLVGVTFALRLLPGSMPQHGPLVQAFAAVLLLLLLGISLVAHERAHDAVARWLDVEIRPVLHGVFGGYEVVQPSPLRAGHETLVALAGPAVSLLLAALAGAAGLALSSAAPDLAVLALYLSLMNGVLGVINLLPAAPLDGGRVLRALFTDATGSDERGTRAAVKGGNIAGALLVVLGLWLMAFHGLLLAGGWTALAGWLVHAGAVDAGRQNAARRGVA